MLRNVEKGRVLMYGSTVHVSWSNLPLRPIFLPLMARLTFELAEVERKYHNLIAGQPLLLQLPNETTPIGIEIIPPGGETLRLKTEGVEGKPGQTFRYANTHDVGIYLLRRLDTVRTATTAYAVNFDPDEADGVKMEHEPLQQRLAPMPVMFADNPDDRSCLERTRRRD